jgi:hypothetical protein
MHARPGTYRGFNVASVWVLSLSVKDIFVQIDVVVVDGIVERDGDHHGNIFRRQIPGHSRAILRAEAIGQNAHSWIARWRTVGIVVDICNLWRKKNKKFNVCAIRNQFAEKSTTNRNKKQQSCNKVLTRRANKQTLQVN